MGIPRCDVLVALMGAPHASDITTTGLRLAHALLGQGAVVQMWTCGYATLLTQRSLGEVKPRNFIGLSTDYPTTVTLARELLASGPDRVRWYSCRFCSDERGVAEHIPEVEIRPAFKFSEHIFAAEKSLFLGVV